MEGDWINYVPGDDGKRKLLISTMETANREMEIIRREDVPEIFTPEVKQMISYYYYTKRYGLPYSGGWAEQPCIVMDIINTLDNEDVIIRGNYGER